MTTILIGIPTARFIESETFKSIYDLDLPAGVETTFQCFYGYRVDQVRNLIAEHAKNYDYVLFVDSDMKFPRDTLDKLWETMHNYDEAYIVSALYRQRTPDINIEAYNESYYRLGLEDLKEVPAQAVGAVGLGCALVDSEVFKYISYPWFEYHPALDHAQTFSEDLDFCRKVNSTYGQSIFLRTDAHASQIGSYEFSIPSPKVRLNWKTHKDTYHDWVDRLEELSEQDLLPEDHKAYLFYMYAKQGIVPKRILDIGACVLHWTKHAKDVWPSSRIYAIDAMSELETLYEDAMFDKYIEGYSIKLLSDSYGNYKEFYCNPHDPGGNSYYKENPRYSPRAEELFPESSKRKLETTTLDTLFQGGEVFDLIKMDCQGSELDILRGGVELISRCSDLILELQSVEYNIGAPRINEVIDFLYDQGFVLVAPAFSKSVLGVDADYHFSRKK